MAGSVLIAYATKHGSTLEVANEVAASFREHGLTTTVRATKEVDDLTGFDGVVLGAALYMGRVHADARHFLKKHRRTLETTPLAVFALGPLTLEEQQMEGSAKQLQHALDKTPTVRPVSVAIFGGVVVPGELSFPFNHIPAGDARDWDEIHRWAEEVAPSLGAHSVELMVR